ncbi:hypothetical protein TWF694_002474 [Orbilia ellipsospora]|uniref:Uncharacterized protein n=1 Tax=Orbilia ellipsospora TaxID=2528407 RepID=A0AAV9X228_9PEZI
MPDYDLSIVIFGDGSNPAAWQGSHWAFGVQETNDSSEKGDLLQVLLLDESQKWYHFDKRENVTILDPISEGKIKIATLSSEQNKEVVRLISQEPAPRDGKKGCQDWVIECLLTLETQDFGLIPNGTVDFVSSLVRKPVTYVASQAGEKWTPTKR